MKQKYIYIIIIMTLVLTACGTNKSSNLDTNNEGEKVNGNQTTEKEETNVKDKEDYNWVGIKSITGYSVAEKGNISFEIEYPSLSPTSSGCTYQKDASLVVVASPGRDSNLESILIDKLENTFETSKNNIVRNIEDYRDYRFDDFDFVIETQELMTINGLEVCKYTGKHTYTLEGEAQEIYFVAYAVDTKQVENTYPTILVINDSINNPEAMTIPDEAIEVYARKMVESIVISD